MTARIHASIQWAELILPVVDAEFDPRTVDNWANLVAAAPNTLRHRCQVVELSVKDSLDVARLLRAIIQSTRIGCRLERLLDVKDPRTLQRLLRRGGLTLSLSLGRSFSALDFLKQQTLIRDASCLNELERLLRDAGSLRRGVVPSG